MRSARFNTSGLLTLIALLAAWQITLAAGAVHFDYLPAPSTIAAAVIAELRSGQLVRDILHTVSATVMACLLAMVIGGVLGLMLGLWRPLRIALIGSINVLRPLPTIAFVPVAVLLLGFSTTMEVTVATVAGVWPMLVNTMGGVQSVHQRLEEVGATLRLAPLRRVRTIVLPAAAPMILVGARLAMGITLVVVVVAEMIGNPSGLGYQIVQTQQALRPDAMFAYVLAVGAVGIALNATLVGVAGRFAGHLVDPRESSS